LPAAQRFELGRHCPAIREFLPRCRCLHSPRPARERLLAPSVETQSRQAPWQQELAEFLFHAESEDACSSSLFFPLNLIVGFGGSEEAKNLARKVLLPIQIRLAHSSERFSPAGQAQSPQARVADFARIFVIDERYLRQDRTHRRPRSGPARSPPGDDAEKRCLSEDPAPAAYSAVPKRR